MGKKQGLNSKRELVMAGGKKSSGSIMAAVAVLLLIGAFAAYFLLAPGGVEGRFAIVKAEAGNVRIPVSDVNDGKARFYRYHAGDRNVDFFVVKSSDGIIRAAFDACDVCYPEKKGYRQEGDFMICVNCGQKFASKNVNEVRGGCNPSPLERRIEGESVVITTKAIEEGKGYF